MIRCTFESGHTNSLRHVVVDTLVFDGDKILLVKRANKLLEMNKWALIGGFVERDETVEQAVKREVKEETGWEIKNLKLLKINDDPKRPHEDRQNISFVFTCMASRKTGKADAESSQTKWFHLNRLPKKDLFAFDHYQDIVFYKSSTLQ